MANDITTIGQISYPTIFKAGEEIDPTTQYKGYSVELLVDAIPENLQAAIDQAVNDKFGHDEKLKKKALASMSCIKKGTDPNDDDREVYRLRFKRRTDFGAPVVIGPQLQQLEEGDVYGGCMGRVKFRAYAWQNVNGVGVGLGFSAVQKTGEGESFASSDDLGGFDAV